MITQTWAFSGKYPIQNFSPTDYKAGIQNIDFAQNRDMTIFIANNLGVLSYNGNAWNVNAFNPGKKERSLAFDKNTNRLYVGSQGTFGYFEKDWEYVSLSEKLPAPLRDFDEVWDVFLLNTHIYFCTFQGIFVYDGQSVAAIQQEGGFNRSFLVGDKIFTQNQQGKLYELKDRQLIPVLSQLQNEQTIAGIIALNTGYLLFYNSGEIIHSTSLGISQEYDDLEKLLKGKYINHVLQLSDNRLAIATQTAGLFLYDLQNKTVENISAQDGLHTNACLRTFQDYSGSLWVGLQNGIALIDINSPMRFINQEIKMQGSGYEGFEVAEGTYYTTSNGIYFLALNTTQSVFLSGTEGPAYGMQRIQGKLYAGHHTGLFLLENGKAKRLANTEGLWQIKQLRSNPAYAIGGSYSGLYLFRIDYNNTLQIQHKIKGFDESSRFFEEDRKGRIWVGQFYKGLYQLNLKENLKEAIVKKVSDEYNLPINEQIILNRVGNELYLGTQDGVYQLDQATDKIIKAKLFEKEIGDQTVYLLVQDKQQNIHVFAENLVGFYKQISADNYVFVPSSLYQLRYYFNNDLLNISIHSGDGVLFNANEGFIQYKPSLENQVSVTHPLIISKALSVTEDSLLYTRHAFHDTPEDSVTLEVSYRDKVLQFEVESFQFKEVNRQQFRYFLKGFDEDYSEWTNSSKKEYTTLEEGNYEFYAQTRNYLGQIITSPPLKLQVQPPFQRSILAKILYFLLVLLILYFVSRRQKSHFKQKAKEVESEKQIELEQKEQELIAIEQKKQQELLQLEEDKVKNELRHINNLLAASTMNLVVKNEFIVTIKEKLQDVNRKGKNKETKQALEQIVKEIDVTLRLQEDWEQFEHHFDQVHGNFLSRLRTRFIDLTPNEQKLCAFLRLNLNTKDIANLMGISLRGVEVARYRLRKKLDLNKGQNLSKFILEF